LKGHAFSRAASWLNRDPASAAEEMQVVEDGFPQGLKPKASFYVAGGTAKAVPFQNIQLFSDSDGSSPAVLKCS
jgi:hypothetical protein